METGLKQAKSTGYTPSTSTAKEGESVQAKSTDKKKASPVFPNAPLKVESLSSTSEVSASNLLAIRVILGDFKALKAELPASRMSSSNGKIYLSVEIPGHLLAVESGKLLVDGAPVDSMLEKLLAEASEESTEESE